MSNRQNYFNTNLVLLRLGLSEVAQNLHNRYTDITFVIPPGILKSSQPIGDDPYLCMALNLTYNFVRYSYDVRTLEACWINSSRRQDLDGTWWWTMIYNLCILTFDLYIINCCAPVSYMPGSRMDRAGMILEDLAVGSEPDPNSLSVYANSISLVPKWGILDMFNFTI